MADIQVIGGIRKLNSQNYNTWQTCMESYFQGQDLREIIGGSETTPPSTNEVEALQKWKIKVGKTMFALKTTMENEILEHIKKTLTPKEACDTFATLFSKKNDTRLQLQENELLSTTQGDLTINQYFTKL